ncbi:efflux RND transporter periplasmic adaptor subunit [Phenylobacterium sp.]|uniref:efflux RND transporter periplasmic adaptor subunit n=1 Tax=Phenylobacterium sp. TaxID=1871053 RepID=UPI002E3774B1|nr:efflux RND transporter periplasmic adaptor subunit [Phenylobacterium sp.]
MPTSPPLQKAALAAAALSLALAALAGCSPKPSYSAQSASATPTLVTLTAAQLQHIRLYTIAPAAFHKTVEASGVVDFDNDQATSVLSPISGPVSRLLVQPGQVVKAGDTLATVDSPDYAAALSAYAKALATARTLRQLADADKDLAAHKGVSQREAQQAQTDAVNAEADRDAALQALVGLNIDPQAIKDVQAGRLAPRIEGKIRSPIAGTVVEKLITPGQLLQAGTTPAFTVANLSKVWVMAQIAGSDIGAIGVGDPASVETGVGPAVTGAVDNIAALVNPDTRAVLARVVVANPGGVLKKQMYVRVKIQSRPATNGLVVPASAVLRDDENLPFVYVAQPGGGFARKHVTLGYATGDQYEVPAGLSAGDKVVVDGAVFVQFMQNQ